MLLTVFWSALYYEICLLLRDGWDIICHTRIPFPYGIINGFVRTFWLNEYPSISLPSLITWQNWCIVGFRRKVEHRTSSMTFSEKGEVGSRRVGSSPSPLPPWMPYGSATAFSWTTAHIYLPDQTTGWFCFTHKFNVKAYLVPSVQHSATCLPAVADLRGARGTPPWGPNYFNFMQFLAKFDKIVCWRLEGWHLHLEEILDPPLLRKL